MHHEYIDAGWPRQVVREVDVPNWAQLEVGPKPWLWLNGAHSPELESEVQALAGPFSIQWVWRRTPREYEYPGFKQGPMLLPLNASLLEAFTGKWGPEQAGLILLGPEDPQLLLRHLRDLNQLTGSDGQPISFQLNALRTLEEMCEASPSEQLVRLFGPIESTIWHAGDDLAEWLQMPALGSPFSDVDAGPQIILTGSDEAALNLASRAWFMRHFARLMTRRFPIFSTEEPQLRLRRQLGLFAEEAQHFGFQLERDIRLYMELRLRYPQEAFTKDSQVHELLRLTNIQGLQRLFDISDKLRQNSAPSI